jgi:hypothetical protein
VPLAMVDLSLDLGNRQGRLEEAEVLKQEGNDLFRLNKWNEALQSYRNGLARLPKRRRPPAPQATPHNEQGDPPPAAERDTSHSPTENDGQSTGSASPSVDTPLERECAKTRSVLNANIAACHVKLVRVRARKGFKVESISLFRAKMKMPLKRAPKVCYGYCHMDAPAKRTLSFAG